MSQVATYQVPAHPSGLDMRTQLNAIVLALIGDSAGPTAPTETYPGMWWGDTTAKLLKRRTNANDAWVTVGPLDDFLADIRTSINTATNTKVSKTGDTMTGSLIMKYTNVFYQDAAGGNYGYIGTYGTAGAASGSGIGFVDSTLKYWNLQIENNGATITRGTATINGGCKIYGGRLELRQPNTYGEAAMYSTNGTVMYMRGRGTEGGGMQWINNDYNLIVADMDNGGNFRFSSFNVATQSTVGGTNIATNGDISGAAWNGAWLSQWLAAYKADKNANCQWQVGAQESGWITINGGQTVAVAQPYVLVGLRNSGSSIYLLCTYLRNN
jgi:hypothetical protein